MKFKQTILISMILLFFSCNKKEYVDSLNGIYLWKDSENGFELLSFKTNGELTSTMCDKGTVYQDISGVYEINGPDLTLRLNEINKTTYATYELDEEDIYIIDEYSKARLYKHQQNNPDILGSWLGGKNIISYSQNDNIITLPDGVTYHGSNTLSISNINENSLRSFLSIMFGDISFLSNNEMSYSLFYDDNNISLTKDFLIENNNLNIKFSHNGREFSKDVFISRASSKDELNILITKEDFVDIFYNLCLILIENEEVRLTEEECYELFKEIENSHSEVMFLISLQGIKLE